MKKFVGFLLLMLTILCICSCNAEQKEFSRYLRIHIRANANDTDSQDVKYIVKDEVVKYLTPHLAECDSKDKALSLIANETDNIKDICRSALKQNGFDYGAEVLVINEYYPTRDYNGFTLESGYYDSLVIKLGEGGGDNWWCMIYPPLCFTGADMNGSGSITYKSKIAEIIEEFFK